MHHLKLTELLSMVNRCLGLFLKSSSSNVLLFPIQDGLGAFLPQKVNTAHLFFYIPTENKTFCF